MTNVHDSGGGYRKMACDMGNIADNTNNSIFVRIDIFAKAVVNKACLDSTFEYN